MAHQQLPKAAAAASAAAASLKASKAFTSLDAKAVLTHIGVGMGAASFWRGAWYILDDHLFPDDPATSALTSFGLGCTGMTLSQGLVGRLDQFEKHFKQKSKDAIGIGSPRQQGFYRKYVLPVRVARFGALYTIAISCVLVWRGTWLGWDVVYEMTHPINRSASNGRGETDHSHHHVGIEQLHAHQSQSQQHSQLPQPQQQHHGQQQQQQLLQRINSTDPGHATTSGILSHVVALTVLCGTGLFASVLAPPAATSVIRDFTVKAASMTSASGAGSGSAASRAAAASSKAFGTGTLYSGPAQNLVAQLFGGGSSSSATTTSEAISSSSCSNISTPAATASFHHNTRTSLTCTVNNSNNTVISKSPQLRLKETPKMSRNHNPLQGNTATSIH